jgi:alpha-beta hydrolase superfamily lysophospholipase
VPADARTPMVLIHGAWLTSESWGAFADFFSSRGYDVTAPEWPGKAAGAEAQRAEADDLADLGVEEIVDHSYGFVNAWPADAARNAYERRYVPETGRIFHEAGTADLRLHGPTEVDHHREGRAPMLIVGAEKNHTVPASVARRQHRRYEGGPSPVEYVEFPGRPHLFMTGDGWEEVAEAIDGWLDRNAA